MNYLTTRVDDADPKIVYDGPWSTVDGKQYDGFVGNGKVFEGTLHELRGEGSLSFSFAGSSGRLVGTNVPNPDAPRIVLPSWACAIDGIPVRLPPTSFDSANNWSLCEWSAMTGPHTLTLNVSVGDTDPSLIQPFLVDYISYTSDSPSYLFQKFVEIPAQELLNFDSSWVPFPPHGMSSGSGGSRATFHFFGTGLEMLGYIPSNKDRKWTATTARFSLDSADPVPFDIPSATNRELNYYQYIKIQNLEQSSHEIAITYSGNDTTTPLTLSTILMTSDDPRITVSPMELPFPSAPVVGGILGGAATLLGLGAVVAWLIRRRRSGKRSLFRRAAREGRTGPSNGPTNSVRGKVPTRVVASSETTSLEQGFSAWRTSSMNPSSPIAATTDQNPFVGTSAPSFISEQPPSYTPT